MILILNQFRRLQWKLTLSFALVTTSVIMIINVATTANALYVASSNVSIVDLQDQLEPLVAETIPYFQTDSPDVEGLTEWAYQLLDLSDLLIPIDEDALVPFVTFVPFIPFFDIIPGIEYVALLDAEGTLLVEEEWYDLVIDDVLIDETDALLEAALRGKEGLSYNDYELELTTLFLPVRDNDGILGVVLVGVTLIRADLEGLLSYGPDFYDEFVDLFVVSMVMGTLFGYFASRGLVGRLQTLEKSAEAWALGQFSLKVYDESGDEIGQLGRNLNRMAQQLETLVTTRTELAALEERGRIARDLHDTVKQQVFAAHMQLSSAKLLLHHNVEASETILNDMLQLNKQTQQELTDLIHALRPAALEETGLANAVERYAAEWSQRSGVSSELFTQNEQPLPLISEHALYRIVQEALANVAKHANAQQVNMQLNWQPDRVTLRIQDDGIGFDVPSQRKKGYGLRSMNERLAELGGQVTIESVIGEGTTVIATLPIAKKG